MKKSLFVFILPLFFLVTLIFSCSPDDTSVADYKEGSNEYVNDWMYQQMKKYYRWSATMPDQGNLSVNPKEYFAGLLQKEDIYSYALHPALPETAPQSLRRKFGFDVSFFEFEGKTYGVILYVLADSPAKNSGLQRGQLITQIEATVLNQGNYDRLYQNMITSGQLQLFTTTYAAQSGFSKPKEVLIVQGFSFLQPISYRVIEDKNTKIGYVEIPHFDVGQAQLYQQIFQELKSKSITELILDLRYNGGGDIASATALSIIIAPDIRSGDLFIKFEGNANGGTVDQSFLQSLQSNETKVSFDVLHNVHPSINKVYILCGNRTASASELIINNLKPYINVITIGEKTFGKDVAGFPIEDDRISGTKGWILYPSIYKLFNSRHEGEYSKGINPTFYTNEIQEPGVFALGDRSEILLKTALNAISGNTAKLNTANVQSLPLSVIDTDVDPLLRMIP
ncbi:C-terminal processing protease CtpA/Prc [Flavobacterium araucananum]|uniref:Peptidase S41 n=1 Tax=Flavobacterium araucananum TaxID=946678 RepID=A0A227PIG6_9FLAO|nr:S41 family peptidase [Flavobacterium araucananum]OXG09174.1 peptidase S41 [Flavobacterium araucananum]PWJ99626.1 C-terminal processing protease CtpA/Prc [Flavobacterium araucananum]